MAFLDLANTRAGSLNPAHAKKTYCLVLDQGSGPFPSPKRLPKQNICATMSLL